MKEMLQTLGLNEAFGESADFSGISDQKTLGLSDVAQEVHIGIDENGVEAAAFTEILWAGAALHQGLSLIHILIVNGAECEPYLTSDYRVMLEQPEKVVGGLKVSLQLFDKAKGVIGIEENKPEAIRILSELVKDEPRIQVCTLKTTYPQGGERFLIYRCV